MKFKLFFSIYILENHVSIYFVNVHVESSGFIPREKSMIIVNLRTLRFVVMAHVTATTAWFPVKKKSIFCAKSKIEIFLRKYI